MGGKNEALMSNAEVMVTSDEGFHVLMRIIMLRDIMDHRGFDRATVAKEAKLSNSYIGGALNGRLYIQRGPDLIHGVLDKLESAVTRLTDRRGMLCACSPGNRNHIRDILSMSEVTRETFLDRDAA